MKLSTRALAGASTLALCLSAGFATAAPVPSNQNIATGFGSTQWFVGEFGATSGGPFGGSCSGGGPGLAISDACGPTGASDAYDIAWSIWVNGAVYSAGPTVDLTGTTYTAPVSVMSGLNVSVQYHFVPEDAVARILVSLENAGASAVATTLQVSNNWGSDGGTVVRATSSGDTTVATDDRWIITSDGGPSDPVNLSVMYGDGAGVTPSSYVTTLFNCAGPQGLGTTFNLNVPAGQTQRLMFFAGLGGVMENNNLVASAQASASFFTDLGSLEPNWIGDLSQAELDSIVNWGPGAPAFSTCAGEGYTGDQLKLCQIICNSSLTGKPITPLVRLWTSTFGSDPLCPSATGPLLLP